MFGVAQPTANKRLRTFEEAGLVRPSMPSGRGKGFHYILVR